MGVQLARRLFTVAEYHKMAEAGILHEDDRVELLDGEIVEMTPIGSRHAGLVNRLTRLFSQRAGDQVIVSVQNPIRLGEHSEPQPDLALLRPRADFYAEAHPGSEDVLLVVEVADLSACNAQAGTSAAYDREVKVPLYARFGIPEAWLVDLAEEQLEVFRQPSPQGYQDLRTLRRGEAVAPLLLPDLSLAVDALLG